MTSHLPLITLIFLGVDIVLYMTNWVRPELVALLTVLFLRLFGILTLEEALSGFGSSATVTIISVFILTSALYRSGVSHSVSSHLSNWAKGSIARLIFFVMICAALFSFFMNNIAAAAVLLPVVKELSSRGKIHLSRLLIPMAFGTILGGMATYFTTINILVSNVLHQYKLTGFGVFSFLPLGGTITLVGIGFMTGLGWKWLPDHPGMNSVSRATLFSYELSELYQLRERLWELVITPESPLANRTLSESQIGQTYGLSVLALQRNHHLIPAPKPEDRVIGGDALYVIGRQDRVEQLAQSNHIQIRATHEWKQDLSMGDVEFCEIVVAPRSSVVGKTLKQLRFREKYDLSAIALWRENRSYRTDVGEMPLQFGDALLIFGYAQRMQLLQSDMDFIVLLPQLEPALNVWKSIVTIGMLLAAIAASALGVLHVSEAMLLAALAVVLGKVITMDEAYQAIEWRVVFIVAGLLPLGLAMTKSGLTTLVSQIMINGLGNFGGMSLLVGFLVLAIVFTQFLSGQTTAIVLSPIAISTALKIGANPQTFAMAIAMGASTAFLTPISHSVNLLVMGVGGYRFRDFLRVGFPLTVLVLVVVILILPLFYPLSR